MHLSSVDRRPRERCRQGAVHGLLHLWVPPELHEQYGSGFGRDRVTGTSKPTLFRHSAAGQHDGTAHLGIHRPQPR